MGAAATEQDVLKGYEPVMRSLQESTKQVFSTMLNLEIQYGPVRCDARTSVRSAGVVAMVGMAGAISGNGCLCFSSEFACWLASRFLMAEYTAVDDDVLDAMAELSNMVVGGMKTALEESSGSMELSVPTVVYGESFVTRTVPGGHRFVLHFTCGEDAEFENFVITCCLITEQKNRNYLRELAEFHSRLV